MLRHKLIHSLVLGLFFLIAGSASAQVYTVAGQIRDHQGNVIPAATVIVLSGNLTTVNTATQPGSPLATIYSDPAGTMVINQTSNPVTTNGLGQFVAYAAPGAYVIQAYRNGFQLVTPISITTNGTGCTVGGSAGDLQKNSGSGGCNAAHINDNGSVLTTSEDLEPLSIGKVIYANSQTGSDCGAKINAASTALGGPGEIWINQLCGTAWTTAVNISANYQTLRFIQGGTYSSTTANTISGVGSGIESALCAENDPVTAGHNCAVLFRQANSVRILRILFGH